MGDDDDSAALSPETTASIASPEATTEDEEQQCSIKREKRRSSEDSTIEPVVPSRFHQAASAPMSPSVQNSSLREDSSDETPPSKLEEVSTSAAQQALRGTNNSQTQGRTCVACRKSKVKCSRGSPCDRCARLKLECVAQTRGRGRPVASNKKVKLDTALPRSTPVFRTPTAATPTKSIGRKTGGLPGAGVGGHSKHSAFIGTSENPRLNRAPTRSSLAVPSMALSAVGRREDTGSFQVFPGDVAPHHSVMGSAAPAGYTDPMYSSSDGYRGGNSVISSSMGTTGGDDGGEGVGNGSGAGGRGDLGGAEIHPSHSQLTVEQHAQMSTLDASRFSGVGASGLSTGLAPQLNGVLSMAFLTPRPSGHQIHDPSGGEYGMSGGSWQSNGNGGGIGGSFSGIAGRGTDSNGQQNSPPPAWEDIHSASQMDRVANGGGGGNGHGNSNGGSGGAFDRETMRSRSDGRAGAGGVVVPLEARRSSLPSGVLESMGSSTASGNGNVGGSGSGGENGRDNSSIWADSMVDSDNTPNTSSDPGSAAVVVTASGVATTAGDRNHASSVAGTKQGRSPRWMDDLQRGITAGGSSTFSSGTSLTRRPDSHQAEEVTRLRVDPTETIVEGFWRLYNEQAIHRSKAVLVIRHWALCALDRRSKKLMHKTVEMAKALCINVLEVLNDYGIYAMFHELLCEAEAGTKVSPAPRVWSEHQVKASPYIQELSSVFAAVSIRVVLRGQSRFYHNEMCRELFMSSEDANLMYAANEQDVWSTFVHPDDHKAFFDTFSMGLFRAPAPFSEFTSIFKFRDRSRGAFLALVHIRYDFQDDGNYAAFGLCVRPLPSSKYLLEPGPPENGHTPVPTTTSASVSASSPSPPSTVAPGHSIMIGSNGSVGGGGGGFLPPVDFSTGGSLAVSAANAAVASVAGTSDVNRRSPLPHLDMEMQRRVSSLHGAGSTEAASGAGGGDGWGSVSCPGTYNSKESASTDDSQQQQHQQRPPWGADAGCAPVGGSASSSGIAGSVSLSDGLQSRGGGAGMASASGQGGNDRPGAGSGGGVFRNMNGSWTAAGGEGRDKSVTARMRMTQAGGGGANGLQTAAVMSPKGPGPPNRSRKV